MLLELPHIQLFFINSEILKIAFRRKTGSNQYKNLPVINLRFNIAIDIFKTLNCRSIRLNEPPHINHHQFPQ